MGGTCRVRGPCRGRRATRALRHCHTAVYLPSAAGHVAEAGDGDSCAVLCRVSHVRLLLFICLFSGCVCLLRGMRHVAERPPQLSKPRFCIKAPAVAGWKQRCALRGIALGMWLSIRG